MLEKSKEFQTSTYIRKFVAPDFQKMIRAEAGAKVGTVWVVVDGCYVGRQSHLGECRCVTCGKAFPWRGSNGIDTGHFVGSRCNSIIFEETNVAPQCVRCNRYLSGNQEAYATWMRNQYGPPEIERLQRLRNESRQFAREELVAMRIGYMDRLKAAKGAMQ